MGVHRVWIWACDGCHLVVSRHDYGLPRGWVFVKDRVVTHRCPACASKVDPRRVGIPVVVAER